MPKSGVKRSPALFAQLPPQELRKGDLRKLQIIEATISCLAKKGWAETNYESVGQFSGMKRPHVAYHYPKWELLIEATLKYAYNVGQTIVADYLRDADTPTAQLRAYIEGTFQWLTINPSHASVATLQWHLATFDKKYRKVSTELKRLGTERVYTILGGRKLSSGSTRWKAALAIHGILVGRCLEFITTDLGNSRESLIEQTNEQALRIGKPFFGGKHV